MYIDFMLHRFLLIVILLSVVVLGRPSSASDVPFDSVMYLFVQNPDTNTSKKLNYVETSANVEIVSNYKDSLEKERDMAVFYRNTIEHILEHSSKDDRMESLKKVVEEAEIFDQNASVYHVFYANDKLVIKYFLKDFEFLSQVDSVKPLLKKHIKGDLHSAVYLKLKREIETGEMEESLREIPDESDRAFIYIVLNSMFRYKEDVSSMIENYKYQLTDEKQLYFLVNRFWHKENYDSKKYFAFSWGGAVIKSFGRLSDKIGLSPGMYLGIDFVRKDFLYEWFMDINGCQNKELDSLQFYDMRWDFNFGYTFLKKDHLNLFGYVSAGLGMNGLSARGKDSNDKANNDLPTQFSPAFGAGVMVDLFFTEKDHIHHGLRFRTGVRSLFSGDVLKTSGVRLYASLEWTFREYTKKPIDFDYSFRESGVK